MAEIGAWTDLLKDFSRFLSVTRSRYFGLGSGFAGDQPVKIV
jgi:hypothetical protein